MKDTKRDLANEKIGQRSMIQQNEFKSISRKR